MDPYGLQLPQWTFRLLTAIPGATKAYWKFIGYCTQQLEKRVKDHDKADPDKPDIIHILIDHYNSSDNKKELWPLMCGDSRLMIVAGSDTTATTLSHLFYHIADKPDWQEKLRQEVLEARNKKNTPERTIPDTILKELPILDGMIHEALRLNPPVPSGVWRQAPPEGVMIGSTFIPGDAVIQMPQYSMGRCKYSHHRHTFPSYLLLVPQISYKLRLTPQQQKTTSSIPTNSSPNAGTPSPNSSSTRTPLLPSPQAPLVASVETWRTWRSAHSRHKSWINSRSRLRPGRMAPP